jgi:hypothetical protein
MCVGLCYVRMYECKYICMHVFMYVCIYLYRVCHNIFTKHQMGQGGAILGEEHVVGSVPFVRKSAPEMRLGKQATRNVVRARCFPFILCMLWEIIRTQHFVITGFVAGGGIVAWPLRSPDQATLDLVWVTSRVSFMRPPWNRKGFGS